jgi:hypothetical protein
MSATFLTICGVAVVFYAVFLIECSRPRHAGNKVYLRKLPPNGTVDSAVGRRFLVHLENEMAEFLSTRRGSATLSLIAMALLLIPLAAHRQGAQPTGSAMFPDQRAIRFF